MIVNVNSLPQVLEKLFFFSFFLEKKKKTEIIINRADL